MGSAFSQSAWQSAHACIISSSLNSKKISSTSYADKILAPRYLSRIASISVLTSLRSTVSVNALMSMCSIDCSVISSMVCAIALIGRTETSIMNANKNAIRRFVNLNIIFSSFDYVYWFTLYNKSLARLVTYEINMLWLCPYITVCFCNRLCDFVNAFHHLIVCKLFVVG